MLGRWEEFDRRRLGSRTGARFCASGPDVRCRCWRGACWVARGPSPACRYGRSRPGRRAGRSRRGPGARRARTVTDVSRHARSDRSSRRARPGRSRPTWIWLASASVRSNRAREAEAAIRRRGWADHGRDDTVRDGLAAYDRLLGRSRAAARYRWRAGRRRLRGWRLCSTGPRPMASASRVRGHRARLYRLAAEIDRAGATRGMPRRTRCWSARSPATTFLGYPEIRPGPGMTLCEFLAWLEAYLELVAVVPALSGLEVPAGISGLLGGLSSVCSRFSHARRTQQSNLGLRSSLGAPRFRRCSAMWRLVEARAARAPRARARPGRVRIDAGRLRGDDGTRSCANCATRRPPGSRRRS